MKRILGLIFLLVMCFGKCQAQTIDIFVMPGSDFDRPGLHPRANLNIGIGWSLQKLSRNPAGQELTFSYTYENAGSHGFWHTNQGAHTAALGNMRSFGFGQTHMGAYTWVQAGVTSLTGMPHGVENRLYQGDALGFTYKLSTHNGIWVQEQYNKLATVPWYTTFSVGYDLSF